MSQMMTQGGPQAPPQAPPAPQPDPQAGAAASAGNYPTSSDPAMKSLAVAAAAIQAFIQAEPDPQLKADGAKLLAQCHAILSGGEKRHDAALGLSPALKFVQRQQAMKGQQAQPGPGQ